MSQATPLTAKRWFRTGVGVLLFLLFIGLLRAAQVAFDSRLQGERAPYLQMVGSHQAQVSWDGERLRRGRVRYGIDPTRLDQVAVEAQASVHHEVTLHGLKPDTRYWFAVEEDGAVVWPGEATRYLVTAPESGVRVPLRLWVVGDPGYADPNSAAVRQAATAWLDAHPRPGREALDLWLTTGDNAYRSGSNEQFEQGLFEPYAEWFKHLPLWPVYGNHDARRNAFFDIFSFPTQGELGGLPSNTEHYFSLDYGPLHLIFLDTEASSMHREAAMQRWLHTDLLLNQQPWTIVLFHHPPYTKGSHDSDSESDSHGRMREVREGLLPILEQGGVDLVLAGHSHVYERSHLLACHYGDSTSLQPWMILEPAADGRYQKVPGSDQGTLYAVVGSSAKLDNGPLDHPVMARSLHERGSLFIDIEGDELRGTFVNLQGEESDHFSLTKRPGEPRALPLCTVPEASLVQ